MPTIALIIVLIVVLFFVYITKGRSKVAEPTTRTAMSSYDSPIPPGFKQYLIEEGYGDKIEKYEGRINALVDVLWDKSDRDRAVFFAYAVDCERHGKTMGNIKKAKNLPRYEEFADYVLLHDDLKRSVLERGTREYWEPGHNTKVYRAAKEWFP